MNENMYQTVGNLLLVAGLLGFVGGAMILLLGSSDDTLLIVLGALSLLFVGTGSAMKNRSRRQPM